MALLVNMDEDDPRRTGARERRPVRTLIRRSATRILLIALSPLIAASAAAKWMRRK